MPTEEEVPEREITVLQDPNPFGSCNSLAYISANDSARCIDTPELRPAGEVIDPDGEPDPIRPECIALAFSTSGEELTNYQYDPATDRYTAANNSFFSFDAGTGFSLNTSNAIYNINTPDVNSPIGVYTSVTSGSVSVVDCADFTEVIDPTISCVRLALSLNGSNEVEQEFTYDPTTKEFVGETNGTIALNGNNVWVLTTPTNTYTAQNTDQNNPLGLFTAIGGNSVSFIDCNDFAESVTFPDCLESQSTNITGYTLGRWNGTNGVYIADDPATQGTLVFTGGAWRIIFDNITYTGSTDQNQSTGLYQAVNGNFIVVMECS